MVVMKKMNNQERGKSFEIEFCEYLQSQGYWVHYMNPSRTGAQPFDILALRDNDIMCFDCKTLAGSRFHLNRIEPNQELAFKSLNAHGIQNTYFVIAHKGGWSLFPSQSLLAEKDSGTRSVKVDDPMSHIFQVIDRKLSK